MEGASPAAWGFFGVTLAVLLAVDLFSHRGGRERSRRWSVTWAVIWMGAGAAFAAFVHLELGGEAAGEYLAAWLIEKSLSVDNLFVWLVIFRSLEVPQDRQRRVLTWGIFGALAFRAVFIVAGAAALERFSWLNWVFAGILLWAAVRVFREDPAAERESRVVRWLSRRVPVTEEVEGSHFFLVRDGRRVATPLLVALVAVELTDVLFAIDSVPAAFSVTTDVFVVYTSNAFAILGLRSLYAVVADAVSQLRYLHHGLAAVLAFAAVKTGGREAVHLPAWLSIAVIAGIMALAVAASLWLPGRGRPRKPERRPAKGEAAARA
jgi:tellurite resistance protein TerC